MIKLFSMFVLTIVLLTTVLLLSLCYWYQTRSRFAKLINQFPLVAEITPLLGNVLLVSRHPKILFKQARQILASFRETFCGWAGLYGFLHVVTADDAEILLSNIKYIDKGILYELLGAWLKTGLLTSTGVKWHHRRKMLTPAFHFNILKISVRTFGEHAEQFVEKLKKESKRDEVLNILPLIAKLTLATICESSMGIKLDENDAAQTNYYNALHRYGDILIDRVLSPWTHSDFMYYTLRLFPNAGKEMKIINLMHEFTKKVIRKREQNFQDSDVMDLETKSEEINSKKRLSMLDLLISAKRQRAEIDDEGIREEVDTFVFEGHDTTAVGISFAIFLLAQHGEHQKKVIAELDEIFGDSKRHATYEDLHNMKYLELCLKESLRLFPSVPFIIRNLTEDTQLTHHIAPAGTDIFIHIYNIHRDPKYFPDPEKFDPDRFLPENSKGRHPYAYIPFSAGPRNCIGQKFAMLELKSIISYILRNFVLESVHSLNDLEFAMDLILRVKGPMYVKFIPRE